MAPTVLKDIVLRWVEHVREGHSALGMLPGFYDGWLLDNEGYIRDPFTRFERTAALGLRVSTALFVSYFSEVALDSRANEAARAVLQPRVAAVVFAYWDTFVVAVIKQFVHLSVGASRCKAILQNDWDRLEGDLTEEATRRRAKATFAKVWAVLVTVFGVAFFTFTSGTERTRGILTSYAKSFVMDVFIIEPLTILGTVVASFALSRPIAGVSYQNDKKPRYA